MYARSFLSFCSVVGPFRVVGKIIYRVLGESLLPASHTNKQTSFLLATFCLAVPEKSFFFFFSSTKRNTRDPFDDGVLETLFSP